MKEIAPTKPLSQVNLFGIIKIVGEFNGGGIHPFHRIEVPHFPVFVASQSLQRFFD